MNPGGRYLYWSDLTISMISLYQLTQVTDTCTDQISLYQWYHYINEPRWHISVLIIYHFINDITISVNPGDRDLYWSDLTISMISLYQWTQVTYICTDHISLYQWYHHINEPRWQETCTDQISLYKCCVCILARWWSRYSKYGDVYLKMMSIDLVRRILGKKPKFVDFCS